MKIQKTIFAFKPMELREIFTLNHAIWYSNVISMQIYFNKI